MLSLVKLMYFCFSVKKEFRSSKKTKGGVETLLSPVKLMYFCSSVRKKNSEVRKDKRWRRNVVESGKVYVLLFFCQKIKTVFLYFSQVN